MPTYEYECKKCDKIFEVFQSITAEKLKTCPDCGAPIRRLLGTGSGIVFKGSGFYETDFKNKSSKSFPESKPKKEETKSASSESTPSAPKETKASKESSTK